jgi:hypothetical protein
MINKLLYVKEVPINDFIHVRVPTVGQVCDNEQLYYSGVQAFTAMPIDFMVQLDDAGIDFTTINEYELFLLLFPALKLQDNSLILGDLDLSKFEMAVNDSNGQPVLLNRDEDIVIDRAIHARIADTLRLIHHLEKNIRKPANEEAKKYLIKRARDKQRRRKNRSEDSQLESLIVAMVNTEQYKYDYESTRSLSIYQFNECVRQIIKKIDYEHLMNGVYAGTVNAKELAQDELSWLSHK